MAEKKGEPVTKKMIIKELAVFGPQLACSKLEMKHFTNNGGDDFYDITNVTRELLR
jgi:hypothetical protein